MGSMYDDDDDDDDDGDQEKVNCWMKVITHKIFIISSRIKNSTEGVTLLLLLAILSCTYSSPTTAPVRNPPCCCFIVKSNPKDLNLVELHAPMQNSISALMTYSYSWPS